MYFVFDTETSGLPNPGKAPNDPDQARIMQLGAVVLDAGLKEVGAIKTRIKWGEAYNVHPKAAEAHGLTREECETYGLSAKHALATLTNFAHTDLPIAFNAPFDVALVDLMVKQVCGFGPATFGRAAYCPMRAMTPLMRLPSAYKGREFKWPKLQEAYTYCYGRPFDGAHDALADVRATADVFRWLVAQGHYKLACAPAKECATPQPTACETTPAPILPAGFVMLSPAKVGEIVSNPQPTLV